MNQKYILPISLFLLSLLFTWQCRNICFFSDTISQISGPATFFYEQNFKHLFLPEHSLTGHPTLIAAYIATIWKIAGRTLTVSHFALTPFILGFLLQLNYFINFVTKDWKKRASIFILVITNTTLLSQLSQITFDVVHIFAFLLCINAFLKNNRLLLTFGFVLLCLCSMRGLLSGIGLIAFTLLMNHRNGVKNLWQYIAVYLPGLLSFGAYQIVFYLHTHWVIHNPTNWTESSKISTFSRCVRNFLALGWKLIDLGQIGIALIIGFIVVNYLRKRLLLTNETATLLTLLFTQALIFFPVMIIYHSLQAHRYLLPITILSTILSGHYILSDRNRFRIIYSLLLILNLSGSVIARKYQAWDATAGLWPYFSMRQEMISYMHHNQIPIRQTASFFPNLAQFKYIDLSDKSYGFKHLELEKDRFILYSNVYGDTKEFEYKIRETCNVKYSIRKGWIELTLFEKKY